MCGQRRSGLGRAVACVPDQIATNLDLPLSSGQAYVARPQGVVVVVVCVCVHVCVCVCVCVCAASAGRCGRGRVFACTCACARACAPRVVVVVVPCPSGPPRSWSWSCVRLALMHASRLAMHALRLLTLAPSHRAPARACVRARVSVVRAPEQAQGAG